MNAIAAMDPSRVIGCKGKIPWHIPEDFKWFKEQTMYHSLVMGSSTFDSLGGNPLKDRHTYVITNNPERLSRPPERLYEYVNLEKLFDEFNQDLAAQENVWLCGGAKIYNILLPFCKQIYMTHVIDEYEGDVFMPPFEGLFPNSEIIREEKDFWIVRYWK